MDYTTWHDQRPSHPTNTRLAEMRQAFQDAYRLADEYLEGRNSGKGVTFDAIAYRRMMDNARSLEQEYSDAWRKANELEPEFLD